MLIVYQDTIRTLLDQHDYPGVTAEELELFKSQFRTSAFTCRLKSCPRATLGFESEKPRLQHEMTHIRRLRCPVADCKFPPFVSPQALRIHTSKYHSHGLLPKSIRKIQVSPKAIGTPVYQKDPSDTRQHKNLPQMVHEGQTRRKLSEQNDENLSNHRLSSVDWPATDTSSCIKPELPPIHFSFPPSQAVLYRSYDPLFTSSPLPHYETISKKDPDPKPTDPVQITLSADPVPIWEDALTLLDEPSSEQNVASLISLQVLPNGESEQRARPQLPEGTDVYMTPTLATDQIQSSASTFPVAEPDLSPSGSSPPMTPGTPIEDLEKNWDEEGELKIYSTGKLVGKRKYCCQTFFLSKQEDDLYMLWGDCISTLGGYYNNFCQRDGWLEKFAIQSAYDKSYLMAQNILHIAHIPGDIFVVKAQDVFRRFGHLVIKGGRPVHDDYWVADARQKLKEKVIKEAEAYFWENCQSYGQSGSDVVRLAVKNAKRTVEQDLDGAVITYGLIENIPDWEIEVSKSKALIQLRHACRYFDEVDWPVLAS